MKETPSKSVPASLLEPLTAALEGLDPLTQFAKEQLDPLSKMAVEMVGFILFNVSFQIKRFIRKIMRKTPPYLTDRKKGKNTNPV